MAFIIVPIPGYWRSGNQSSKTLTETMKVATPTLTDKLLAIPSASTVHGDTPIPALTNAASPEPKIHRPRVSIKNDLGSNFH
ncbi:unannotated protein [freshwater metagenome]|uniref:Unannotated protein n=1 Tax=freshwater metagenome TaxID=449393 RepID=A0A6J6F0P8_9ZZZZ